MIGITWRYKRNIILYLFSSIHLSLNQKGDECQTTCANQCSRERVQEEENKIEDQALASIREGKTAETSEKDEEMEEVPKQEVKWTVKLSHDATFY